MYKMSTVCLNFYTCLKGSNFIKFLEIKYKNVMQHILKIKFKIGFTLKISPNKIPFRIF